MPCACVLRRILVGMLLSLLCSIPAQAAPGKRHALLVGVREHVSARFSALEYTENDVEELAKVLNGPGGFSSVRVLSTTRGEKRQEDAPTVSNIRTALRGLLAQKTREDTILVALSGHGLQGKIGEIDENFFCPSDAQLQDTRTLLPLGRLFRSFAVSGAGVKLLVMDACRNDPKISRNVNLDLLPRPARGTAALFSCDSGERAFGTDKLGPVGHGVFFHYVLEGMRGEAKNKRGEVTWDALAEYVKDRVSDAVPILIGPDAKQTPQEIKNLRGKAPVLLGAGKGDVAVKDVPTVLGGIEIGAKGVKATVIAARRSPQELRARLLLSGTHNTTLAASIAATGKFDPAALRATVHAVKTYAERMEHKHGVPRENIFIVGGSGPFSAIDKDKAILQARQEELGRAILDATGRKMDFINVQREALLSTVGIVPRASLGTSLLIDVGSGNTKGGYRDSTKKYTAFRIPFGSVTLGEAAKKSPTLPFDAFVRPALHQVVKKDPVLVGRKRIYLSGGAFWALANIVKPSDRSTYTALTVKDIDTYHKMLASNPGAYPSVDLSSLSGNKRKAAEKDLKRIKKTFTPAQLLAGAEIMKGLSKELRLEGKEMYFARQGYLGWILAFAALKTRAR
jgi:hypothetical protein